jgi:hypothetical protein
MSENPTVFSHEPARATGAEACASLKVLREVHRRDIDRYTRACIRGAVGALAMALWGRLPRNMGFGVAIGRIAPYLAKDFSAQATSITYQRIDWMERQRSKGER